MRPSKRPASNQGTQIALALDPAASEFFKMKQWALLLSPNRIDARKSKTQEEMVRLLQEWVGQYPIVSHGDGVAEEDETGWKLI